MTTTEVSKAAFSGGREYTPEEKEKILTLRSKIADLCLTDDQVHDAVLIKWLRARNLDLTKAEDMFRASMKWRKENQIDTILEREGPLVPQDMKANYAIAYCGVSKEGYACFVCPFGRQDMRAMLEKYGIEKVEQYNTIFCEEMMKLLDDESKKHGIKITQVIEVWDCEGYSYRQMATKQCREFMARMQKSFDENYPEVLRYAMIVNAPKVFSVIFNLLKPVIPKATLEKIDIFGPDPEKWKSIVREKFPTENIPPHWGGSLEGADEFCSGHPIWIQGPADMNAFMKGLTEADADFHKVEIASREKFIQEVDVGEVGTILEWKFKSEGHDIGFQLFWAAEARSKKDKREDIIPFQRVNAHTQVQEGSIVCEKVGVYSLVFDNSFSVLKSKTVLYQINFVDATHQANPDAN